MQEFERIYLLNRHKKLDEPLAEHLGEQDYYERAYLGAEEAEQQAAPCAVEHTRAYLERLGGDYLDNGLKRSDGDKRQFIEAVEADEKCFHLLRVGKEPVKLSAVSYITIYKCAQGSGADDYRAYPLYKEQLFSSAFGIKGFCIFQRIHRALRRSLFLSMVCAFRYNG